MQFALKSGGFFHVQRRFFWRKGLPFFILPCYNEVAKRERKEIRKPKGNVPNRNLSLPKKISRKDFWEQFPLREILLVRSSGEGKVWESVFKEEKASGEKSSEERKEDRFCEELWMMTFEWWLLTGKDSCWEKKSGLEFSAREIRWRTSVWCGDRVTGKTGSFSGRSREDQIECLVWRRESRKRDITENRFKRFRVLKSS